MLVVHSGEDNRHDEALQSFEGLHAPQQACICYINAPASCLRADRKAVVDVNIMQDLVVPGTMT